MALLETIQRRLLKNGSLEKILRLLPRISFLLGIGSIILLIQLAVSGQYRNTYISENALMPSQAHAFYRESEWNIARGYRNELINMMNFNQTERNAVLEDWLNVMGYKTSYSTYINEKGEERSTLYAIYHVPKGDDTEAMVLIAPWKTEENKLNINGLAISFGLGQYFHRLSIWAKNIILVFPDNAQEDLRQWVDAYHTSLENTGGSLESAIILEHASTKDQMSYIEIEYAGVNGQLPNLDMVNTAILIAEHEGYKISLNHAPENLLQSNNFYTRVTSLFSGIIDLAAAGSIKWTDSQSLSGWNIQAITIRGKGESGPDITVLGRVIESSFRSVNNLLEKFHQSFFFYLLLGPKHFVSIASYLPAGGLVAFAFVVSSINAFIGGGFIKRDQGDSLLYGTGKLSLSTKSLAWAFGTAVFAIFSTISYGLYLMKSCNASISQEQWEQITIWYFILPLSMLNFLPLLSIVVPFQRLIGYKVENYIRALSTIMLFYFGYMLVALLVLNFALSLVIGLCALGLCFIRTTSSKDQQIWVNTKLKNTFLLLITSPVSWLFTFGILNSIEFKLDRVRQFVQNFGYALLQREIQKVLDFVEDAPSNIWIEGPANLFKSLILSYSHVQCWTWLFICLSWLPVWLCMTIIASLDGELLINKQEDTEKEKNE